MNIEILFFGQLTDISGCHSVKIENPIVAPLKITEPSIIACMPPFSGG